MSCTIDFFFSSIILFSVVPHITDAIQEWVMKQARVSVDDDGVEPQVCVIEVSLSLMPVPFPHQLAVFSSHRKRYLTKDLLCI